jgi:putative effector of murein hydrolase
MSRERKTVTILPKAKISKTIDMTKASTAPAGMEISRQLHGKQQVTPTVTTSGFQIGR